MSHVHARHWGAVLGLILVQAGVTPLAAGDEPRQAGVRLFTPEPKGAMADKGYLIQWKDSDTSGYTIRFSREELSTGPASRTVFAQVDAGPGGFSGNQYLWDTSAVPEGVYHVLADLLDADGKLVATSRSEGLLTIRHEPPVPGQEIYIYAFAHLKNQFNMDNEQAGIARMLQACRGTGYRAFEITFNWPIAWYLENGLADDRPGHEGSPLFEACPALVQDLRQFADEGGSLGCYDPLAGWHYRNLWFEYPNLLEDWHAFGVKAIEYETLHQDQVTGDLDPNRLGSKRYLDQVFGRQTVELAGNLPVVCYHITKLLGNRVLAQMSPQNVGSISGYRFIDGRDYMDGRCVYWYLGQLGFTHFPASLQLPHEPEDVLTRQIPMLQHGRLYDPNGIPLDDPQCQSIQQGVDAAISGIRANRLPVDIMYIFEHSISFENMDDAYAMQLEDQLARSGFNWMEPWGLMRLAHMNCAPELRLPGNYWDYQFRPQYKASAQTIDLRGQIIASAFQYVQHLARTDPHIHLVTGDDLYDRVLVQEDKPVTSATLTLIAQYVLEHLYREPGADYVRLPAYVALDAGPTGGRYYTLAETFKLLADALAAAGRGEPLPEQITLPYVLGPTQLRNDFETAAAGRSFQVSEILDAVRGLSMRDPLADAALWPQGIVPGISYQVPSYVAIGATTVEINAAEMLILMARAYLAIQGTDQGPDATAVVKAGPARCLSEWAYKVEASDGGYSPWNVNVYNNAQGQFHFSHIQLWTFKPAEFVSP